MHTLLHNNRIGEIGCEYFCAVFSQQSQIPGLSGGVYRFCRNPSVYSQLARADKQGQTENSGVYYVTLAKNLAAAAEQTTACHPYEYRDIFMLGC